MKMILPLILVICALTVTVNATPVNTLDYSVSDTRINIDSWKDFDSLEFFHEYPNDVVYRLVDDFGDKDPNYPKDRVSLFFYFSKPTMDLHQIKVTTNFNPTDGLRIDNTHVFSNLDSFSNPSIEYGGDDVVPEPATFAIAGLGGVVLLTRRRRRGA